jgi:hypothetical protein
LCKKSKEENSLSLICEARSLNVQSEQEHAFGKADRRWFGGQNTNADLAVEILVLIEGEGGFRLTNGSPFIIRQLFAL